MLYSELSRSGTMKADGPRNKSGGSIDPLEDEIDLNDIPDDEFGDGWGEDDLSDQPGGEDYYTWEELDRDDDDDEEKN